MNSKSDQKEGSHVKRGNVRRIYGDVPPFMGVSYVKPSEAIEADAVVLGMPFDGLATFRGGPNRRAPQEIRKYSLLFGDYNIEWDIRIFDYLNVIDIGDVDVFPGDTKESFSRLERWISSIVSAHAVPLMIGGDHAVSYPAVRAVVESLQRPVGFIVFDTHLDFQESLEGDRLTRASPTLRICELERVDPRNVVIIGARGARNAAEWGPRAKKMGVKIFTMADVEREGIQAIAEKARELASPNGVPPYVSVDVDGIDPAYAPATNSPEPGGLTSREIITAIREVASQGVSGFDVVEVSPEYDNESGTTSILAARLMEEVLCAIAAVRRNAPT